MQNKNKLLTILICAALLAGCLLGFVINHYSQGGKASGPVIVFINEYLIDGIFEVIGQLFIRTLKMMVVPLVFVSLVCGTTSLVDIKQVGRIGIKTIALYLFTTALAITMAISVASFLFSVFTVVPPTDLENIPSEIKQPGSLKSVFINLLPTNPFEAMVKGDMLQIIIFSIFFGLCVNLVKEKGEIVIQFFEALNEVVMKMIMVLVWFAPLGVFCLITITFAKEGLSNINKLLIYFIAVLLSLSIHFFVNFPLMLLLLAKLNPIKLVKKIIPVMMFGFSTASSNATIPITKKTVEKDLGVDNSLVSFTIPLGATINMDGTAIMQGVATIFIASLSGVDLTLAQLLTVVLTATLASIGTAGVPSAGTIMLVMVLNQVGLPIDKVALILAVDRLLDMTRTSVNLVGDAVVTCIVAKSEGKINQETYDN